ncbi:MAG TPA: Sec-independent protein translocase protein TatB [Jiangellaceae bacterium]
MFDIGMGEILVLLIVALLVFGPDRLPTMAKQTASFIRDLRAMVANARRDLSDSVGDLGIDKDDLATLSDLRNPKSFVRQKVLDGVDLGVDDLSLGDSVLDEPTRRPKPRAVANGSPANGSPVAGVTGTAAPAAVPDAPPPFDPDAT